MKQLAAMFLALALSLPAAAQTATTSGAEPFPAEVAPPPPEPVPPPPPPPPAAPAQSASRPPAPPPRLQLQPPELGGARRRHSRISAGPGGPLYILEGVVTGLVAGGFIGAASDRRDLTFLGSITGGLLLGAGATALQYKLFMTIPGAAVDGIAAIGGLSAGAAIASLAQLSSTASGPVIGGAAVLAFFASAVAHADVEVTAGDGVYVGGVAIYATIYTALIMWLLDTLHVGVDFAGVGFAPLAGLAVGGVTARWVNLGVDRALPLVLIPVGLGAIVFFIGLNADDQSPAVPGTMLLFVSASLGALAAYYAIVDAPADAQPQVTSRAVLPFVTALRDRTGFVPAAGFATRF